MTIRRTPAGVRAVSAPLALAALVALVAGCTSAPSPTSSPPAASQAATSAAAATPSAPGSTATATAGSTATATAGPGGSGGTGGAGGGTPSCATRDLKVAAGLAQGAAGSVYQVIDFTNISGAPCTLFGYPGVALAGGSPVTQVGAAASRSGTSPARLVTLGAGSTANALLRITQALNYPSSKCHPVSTTYLQIYPPNQTTPVYLGYKATACSATSVNLLSVGVVQEGKGG
jgi:Domain of unknown function (DUF4232)